MAGFAVQATSVGISESALGRRLACGDVDALDECYRVMISSVRSYVGRFVAPHEVDDVTQRTFYEVWRARERYDSTRSFRAWVLGIARKRAIDQLRCRQHDTVPLEWAGEVPGDDGREVTSRLDDAQEVRFALRQLPEGQRRVITLAYFYGYTQAEIAQRTALPLGTVKTRTARGLTRLGILLENGRALPRVVMVPSASFHSDRRPQLR